MILMSETNVSQLELTQGLLKLLWTVYSEEKLQNFKNFKLRKFQNPFNKDKSVCL